VENEGYWGIAVRPATTYRGSLYAKAGSADIGPMTVSVVSDETGKALAEGTVPSLSTECKRYEFTLSTGNVEASRDNHLQLTLGHAGTVWIDLDKVGCCPGEAGPSGAVPVEVR
jgi:alpha-N-arabinofuranosidase